jgi:flavin-dependent dehydrogenase
MYDVAIIGGGPAGSSAGSLLKKYNPDLKVLILEREKFPRDHVGESQLPPISKVLDEMGCWEKVEKADFPIKIGVTYRWGKTPELWNFQFIQDGAFVDEPRPAKYEGQRKFTAFQVDRAVYDEILLDHAAELGCEVRQETRVVKVLTDGDKVEGLQLGDGNIIQARYYFDASGHSGILRRAMGVETDSQKSLQNIAIWDYWQNAEWAVEIGVGGTRVQVMSLPYGWIWFIPLGPTRTSVGLVTPAEYYKGCGMKPHELYAKAIGEEERIAALLKNAKSESNLSTTKDWSFVATRLVGENWFLIGESAGFADPILAAGLTLAQWSAREAAYTILELDKGKHNADWLKQQYEHRQQRRVSNHIRFADYWYTANAQFQDLRTFTQQLAADNGLDLDPEKAWAWLSQGGFIDEDASIGAAGFDLDQIKELGEFMNDLTPTDTIDKNNIFRLNLAGATYSDRASYAGGQIAKTACYTKGERVLPIIGPIELIVEILQRYHKLPDIVSNLMSIANDKQHDADFMMKYIVPIGQTLEAMINDGWVDASYDPSLPLAPLPPSIVSLSWEK